MDKPEGFMVDKYTGSIDNKQALQEYLDNVSILIARLLVDYEID